MLEYRTAYDASTSTFTLNSEIAFSQVPKPK